MELVIDPSLRRRIAIRAALRVPVALLFMIAVIFLPAGTLRFWQGWLYLAVLAGCGTTLLVWLYRRDPSVIERRLKMREPIPWQRRLMSVSWVIAVAAYALPGFDFRFGWSHVPAPISIAANGVTVVAYVLFAFVLHENRWASRVIEVEPGQTVVTTGPYAHVRHPLYSAALLIYAASPVALGSWWALLTVIPLIALLVFRIRNEEAFLTAKLEGYAAYAERVRWKVVPGVL